MADLIPGVREWSSRPIPRVRISTAADRGHGRSRRPGAIDELVDEAVLGLVVERPHGHTLLHSVAYHQVVDGVGEPLDEIGVVGAVHVDPLDVVTDLPGSGIDASDELVDELVGDRGSLENQGGVIASEF